MYRTVGMIDVLSSGIRDVLLSKWSGDQAIATSRLLVAGSVAVVPDTAYLTPLEAPDETVRLVRQLWGATEATG